MSCTGPVRTEPSRKPCWGVVLATAACFQLLHACSKPEPPAPAPAATAASVARKAPDIGGTEREVVKVTGRGPNVAAAIDDAIGLAIRQVNGQTVEASSASMSGGVAVTFGADTAALSSTAFAQAVATHYRGAVTGFKLLAQRPPSKRGEVEVDVEVSVARYRQPESVNLPRIVVAPIRVGTSSMTIDGSPQDSDAVAGAIRQGVIDALARSGRFTVLDRDMTSEVESELELIDSGQVQNVDFARLGQALAADLIWVGVLEEFGYARHERRLRTSDRILVSRSGGARMAHRLINVATRQIVSSDRADVQMPETEPTTMGAGVDEASVRAQMVDGLAGQAASAVITRLFPVTIVALSGSDVVLSQGGASLREGRRYRVFLLGEEMTDPQTGRSLGRADREVGIVEVTRVGADVSNGVMVETKEGMPVSLVPGALEVRDEVAQQRAPEDVAAAPVAKPRAPAKPTRPTDAKPTAPERDSHW